MTTTPSPTPSPAHQSIDTISRMRIGQGWDCHALVTDRPLILGGVHVPHTHGLQGHSDADVLLHAITDAILGAAGLGDIGRHFPDTDAQFKGADSIQLLIKAVHSVKQAGFSIVNIDSTILAQRPKLAPYVDAMACNIAQALSVARAQVNVKAKTAEKLGPVGECLSMEAQAIALLVKHEID
jgi:2-C-methyl-D-erythritol 2,4-cyclodiphosphate synthase